MPESITTEEEELAEEENLKRELKETFLSHPETKIEGSIKRSQYSFLRARRYGMKPDEIIENSTYTNGPIRMTLKERIDAYTYPFGPGNKIVGLKITDTQHSVSAPGRITQVDYLKEVLSILDQERRQEGLQVIRDQFLENPDLDGTRLSGDQ